MLITTTLNPSFFKIEVHAPSAVPLGITICCSVQGEPDTKSLGGSDLDTSLLTILCDLFHAGMEDISPLLLLGFR